ncbi:UPF0761 membrane protein [Frankliniella fusca]|uniref:UPF0761 membrane protein n=1 Tax=Frankliniella fusca TaxID=407009 RepID=A0AAE1H253_9NEOP|nr:UPF0761 membrane protein [Frankliniella fusca]
MGSLCGRRGPLTSSEKRLEERVLSDRLVLTVVSPADVSTYLSIPIRSNNKLFTSFKMFRSEEPCSSGSSSCNLLFCARSSLQGGFAPCSSISPSLVTTSDSSIV